MLRFYKKNKYIKKHNALRNKQKLFLNEEQWIKRKAIGNFGVPIVPEDFIPLHARLLDV
jgi:hypothetical protein